MDSRGISIKAGLHLWRRVAWFYTDFDVKLGSYLGSLHLYIFHLYNQPPDPPPFYKPNRGRASFVLSMKSLKLLPKPST